jgi:hypothetical protein
MAVGVRNRQMLTAEREIPHCVSESQANASSWLPNIHAAIHVPFFRLRKYIENHEFLAIH